MEDNDPRSHARAVSALGDVVVGIFDTAQSVAYGSEAFRWRSGSDMVGLGDFPGKDFWSASRGVSADGTVIVGFGMNSTGYEAFRWTETDGMVGLGDFDGGEHYSLANGISGDGSTIVGFGYPGTDTRAFRWTKGDGMVDLGDPLGVLFDYHAYDASYDGTVIVGSVQDGPYEAVTAFVWDADHGIRSLQVLLENDCGLDLTGWTLTSARGVSDDGKTIVGYGINPDGNTEAWVATVPEPATLGMLALGGLAVLRRRRRC
ncbi:MAG: PEP-CTERM sorting domain-containing protein [Phycisphaerae bacterium]|jgi:probable HAF family extracellular repeat protein|nr:PEP-CTERM sorting domain-containing protein [Phycisphaerae bacterium]